MDFLRKHAQKLGTEVQKQQAVSVMSENLSTNIHQIRTQSYFDMPLMLSMKSNQGGS
jgi:hypothetical protein